MRIAFDAAPLLDEHMSGVGHCEAGLVLALQRLYPEHAYIFNYFSVRGSAGKRQRLSPYMLPGSETNTPTFSPLVYRMMTQFIDRKSTRLNSSHDRQSRMPSSA